MSESPGYQLSAISVNEALLKPPIRQYSLFYASLWRLPVGGGGSWAQRTPDTGYVLVTLVRSAYPKTS
eukprot:scaffold76893_cov23-Tisochrysis_lutea.AAC.1